MNHHNDMHEPPALAGEPGEKSATRRRFVMPLAFGAIAAALLVIGIVPRLQASTALTSQAAAQHALSVSVIKPRSAPAVQELLLPGSVMPRRCDLPPSASGNSSCHRSQRPRGKPLPYVRSAVSNP